MNSKKLRRLMREHDLQRRRHPNLAPGIVTSGSDQLRVADVTYVPIIGSFVYVAVILEAWSRRVVGCAISRSIDARLAIAALNAAVQARQPDAGCTHHSDHEFVGSMSRRSNPYDNAKTESFMKTRKTGAIYPLAYETFSDFASNLPRFLDASTTHARQMVKVAA